MGTTREELLADLRSRLDAIADELADLGYVELREAVGSGKAKAAGERRLSQARRSVLKASALLSDSSTDDS
jgi:hypothetical protein